MTGILVNSGVTIVFDIRYWANQDLYQAIYFTSIVNREMARSLFLLLCSTFNLHLNSDLILFISFYS